MALDPKNEEIVTIGCRSIKIKLICVMNHWIDNDVRQDVVTPPGEMYW